MSRLPWFRMFTESRNDRKLDALTDREFRIWHKLLCYAAERAPRGEVDYLDPEFVAIEIGVGADELDAAIARMVRLRLMERSDMTVMFPAFEARQYDKPSDAPAAVAARVRKHREKKAGNGVTPCNAQNREEQSETTDPVGSVGRLTRVDSSVEEVAQIVRSFANGA